MTHVIVHVITAPAVRQAVVGYKATAVVGHKATLASVWGLLD